MSHGRDAANASFNFARSPEAKDIAIFALTDPMLTTHAKSAALETHSAATLKLGCMLPSFGRLCPQQQFSTEISVKYLFVRKSLKMNAIWPRSRPRLGSFSFSFSFFLKKKIFPIYPQPQTHSRPTYHTEHPATTFICTNIPSARLLVPARSSATTKRRSGAVKVAPQPTHSRTI